MPHRQGRHRTAAWIALVLTILAIVGVFLQWWQFVGSDRQESGVDPDLARSMSLSEHQGMFAGNHRIGVYVVALLTPGLGLLLASLLTGPWLRSPVVPLFGALVLLLTAEVIVLLPMVSHWQVGDVYLMWFEPAYGWWLTLGACGAAFTATVLALRRAALDAHEAEKKAETFD